MAAQLTVEQLQQIILDELDIAGRIADTRQLRLPSHGAATSDGAEPIVGPDHAAQLAVKAAIDSLSAKEMVTALQKSVDTLIPTAEGEEMAQNGSHEFRVWQALEAASPENGVDAKTLQQHLGKAVATIGQSAAFKRKWIKKQGTGFLRSTDAVPEDTIRLQLMAVKRDGKVDKPEELKQRKLITMRRDLYYSIEKGEKFARTVTKLETDLTAEMLQSGSWKSANFKKYNFDAEGAAPVAGALHPLLKVREEFRKIFFEMGFSEMPTNRFVESSFWNFDTLFVPQQHPARDLQDTFFVKDPATTSEFPSDYLQRVKRVHQDGDVGSIGYRYPWQESEAAKLVLRTHTTAVSAAMLYQIAQDGWKPAKLFSIDRVFRNETVDATHLAEFHQVEGVVVDEGITLGDLIGFMETFFAKMGLHGLRFKPAYNPYTEPSLEIFSYHPLLKKWVEIGNSGMFRPEMLEPMGLPKGVRALGWGLSLERPTMIRYGISNIRMLVGHKVPLDMIQRSAAIRF